jgi:superfamily I DNA/RNA helicase
LRNNPAAPERQLYEHLLVDEYQDLNKAEQRVIELLAGNAALCVVGDDDQSLYSFKHAHPEGIRTFVQTHPVPAIIYCLNATAAQPALLKSQILLSRIVATENHGH